MANRRTTLFLPGARNTHEANPKQISTTSVNTLTVDINVTAFSGTSITFTVQGQDSQGNWYTLLASAAISATGRSTLTVGPQSPTAANASANRVVPNRVRVLTSGTITSVNYYVDLITQSLIGY